MMTYTCKQCKKTIETDGEDIHITNDGDFCDDCYYDRLGDIVEKYPIARVGFPPHE
jgi:hypothetical protein